MPSDQNIPTAYDHMKREAELLAKIERQREMLAALERQIERLNTWIKVLLLRHRSILEGELREQALDELIAQAQELGLYDDKTVD